MLLRLLLLAAVILAAALAARTLRRYVALAAFPARFDHDDVPASPPRPLVVEFTSPYCYDCKVALPVLQKAADEHDAEFAVIDARQRPDLAAKYGIRSTPTILVVDAQGRVKRGWTSPPSEEDLKSAFAEAA